MFPGFRQMKQKEITMPLIRYVLPVILIIVFVVGCKTTTDLPDSLAIPIAKYEIQRDEILEALKDPKSALDQAKIFPYFKNYGIDGFKFYELNEGGIFDKLGFEKGDVLKSVNGIEIKRPSDAIKALESMRDSKSVAITVMRKGEEKTYNVAIRD